MKPYCNLRCDDEEIVQPEYRCSPKMTSYRINPEVYDHYNTVEEDNRLKQGDGRLEFARSKRIIERYLDGNEKVILDIGGGTGPYAFWLAAKGHRVHLLDPMPKHVALAGERQRQGAYKLVDIGIADVRATGAADASFDMVLCFGPFYHLTQREDRTTALFEMKRVLKPGGIIMASIISRHTSFIRSGLYDGMLDDPVFLDIVKLDLKNGQHRNPVDSHTYFTTAFFASYRTLGQEFVDAGFVMEKTIAIEGPGWLTCDLDAALDDDARRHRLLDLLELTESDADIMGISPHLMMIAMKPD